MMGLDAATLIARVIVLLVAFTVHELAHAITADRMGDPTPRRMGRISLNPLVHLDPMGTIALLLAGFGWAKPVMVNPMNFRMHPRTGMAIVAAAGPISNLILATLSAIPFRLGLVSFTMSSPGALPSLDMLFTQFILINLALAFFNLIPIPPLDGYKILIGILPAEMGYRLQPLEQYGFLILLGAIFLLPMIGVDLISLFVWVPASAVLSVLLGL